MLELLRIRNLALIEDMELEFSDGMNALTGETGAGKSFILKALSFLLGEKLSAQLIRPGAERAEITGLFVIGGQELILRRELLAASGRSRLYVNDVLSSQERVRGIREQLILHTSQHAQQRLLNAGYQAALIEQSCPHPELLEKKDALIRELRGIAARRGALEEKFSALADRRDLLEMQQQEIDRIAPEEGEEERLEALRAEARAGEERRKSHEKALLLLHGEDGPGLLDMMQEFAHVLDGLARLNSELEEDAESVSTWRQQLSHLAVRLRRPPALLPDVDMEQVEARLFALAQLKRKLHRSMEEIFALRAAVEENLSFLDSCALDIASLKAQEAELSTALKDVIAQLILARRMAGDSFSSLLEQELRELGFSADIRVSIEYLPYEVWPGITDERAHILWAPNPGQPAQPLDRIASGGELSRFLLALVSIRSLNEEATLIFDEIDAGLGGMTLNSVADKLEKLAGHRQVLLITHWPQLAARAKRHFRIQKRVVAHETFTQCSLLDMQARILELERMAGGGAKGKALAAALAQQSFS